MTHFKLVLKYAFSDLRKQKLRTILAVLGMLVSIGLLTVVLFLSDSIAVGYVDFLTVEAGNQDATISVRHYYGEPENRSSYFDYNPLIETIQNTTSVIENFVPRMEILGEVNISEGFYTSNLTNQVEETTISAINFSLEKSINFGAFIDPFSKEIVNLNNLPSNRCAIYYGFNNVIKYSINDTIEIRMELTHGDLELNLTRSLIIDQIFDFNLKWPASYRNRNLIIMDVKTLYDYFGIDEFSEKCSELILTFSRNENLYDVRNIAASEVSVKDLITDIQVEIGIEKYKIDLPKLRILRFSEFLSVLIVIIFIFVSIIAMLISGVLINGILKTSVEERIREFGIFRTLGANKKYALSIVLMQGFLLCFIGSTLGVLLAFVLSRFLIIPFANSVISTNLAGFGSLPFSFSWVSILISYAMGLSVGLIVSIAPALKAMRLQLIESIHPYRHEDTLYHLRKKATVNYKLILIGIILAFNGGFVFYVIPRIMVSTDSSLFAGTLITILLIFNIGLTLAGLGVIPLVLRLVIQAFRPLAGKIHNVIKIFVFRYSRRNSSTVMIFALSFSFVIFTTTIINNFSLQSTYGTQYQYGSDLVIETIGWKESADSYQGGSGFGGLGGGGGFLSSSSSAKEIQSDDKPIRDIKPRTADSSINPNRIMTIEFEEDLLAIDGIEKVSSVLANPFQLSQIYSEENKEFIAEIGDYAGLTTQEITLIGIDEDYPFTVKNEFIRMTSGNIQSSFGKLFDNNQSFSCIISEAIAVAMYLRVNDKVRIVIHRGDELEVYPFEIGGIGKRMPGFSQLFMGNPIGAVGGGVLISQELYIQIMDIPPVPYLDRIFIKLRENALSRARSIEVFIDETYQIHYNYEITNLAREVKQQQSFFVVMDTLFSLIAMTTVFICIFGLLSSSYSTIIERKKEIGIIRTLGLKGKEINRLFIIESLIIMISSGTIGIIVGWLSAWLVTSNLNTLMESPDVLFIPWFNIVFIYVLSIILIFFGMKLLLRKVRKKKIIDIYRETI